jgi:dCMP deaminase
VESVEKDFERWWKEKGFDQTNGGVHGLDPKELAREAWNTASRFNVTSFEEPDNQKKWDKRFIELARHIATWSKDPSTKCGSVIVDRENRVISVGYNGFARGVNDSAERYDDRPLKYKMVVHSERNAILFAKRDIEGCTIYNWPFKACSTCASMVIQAGIKRVVSPPVPQYLVERWGEDMDVLATQMFNEAGVEVVIIDE